MSAPIECLRFGVRSPTSRCSTVRGDREPFHIMRIIVVLGAALLSTLSVAAADNVAGAIPKVRLASNFPWDSIAPQTNTQTVPWDHVIVRTNAPTLSLVPADIVPNSIAVRRARTNCVAVCWTYTDQGAKKALAFWESHPSPHVRYSEEWKTGWLKSPTDKCVFDNEKAALAFMAKLTPR